MSLKNPTKYVSVQRLNRFKQKLDAEQPVATVNTCESIIDELI